MMKTRKPSPPLMKTKVSGTLKRGELCLRQKSDAFYPKLHANQDAQVRKGLEEMRKGRVVRRVPHPFRALCEKGG